MVAAALIDRLIHHTDMVTLTARAIGCASERPAAPRRGTLRFPIPVHFSAPVDNKPSVSGGAWQAPDLDDDAGAFQGRGLALPRSRVEASVW